MMPSGDWAGFIDIGHKSQKLPLCALSMFHCGWPVGSPTCFIYLQTVATKSVSFVHAEIGLLEIR